MNEGVSIKFKNKELLDFLDEQIRWRNNLIREIKEMSGKTAEPTMRDVQMIRQIKDAIEEVKQ